MITARAASRRTLHLAPALAIALALTAGSTVCSSAVAQEAPADSSNTVTPAVVDSTSPSASPVDTVAHARADSATAGLLPPRPHARGGVADTVTVFPTVEVKTGRPAGPERTTGTTVRLTRGDVSRFLPATSADAVESVPGINLVKTGPWAAQIFMRGLGGNRVVVMRDGVRLNTARGHGPMSATIPVDRLQSVLLIPGASSTLYGSGALAGVVDFVTHKPLISADSRTSAIVATRASEPGGSQAVSLWTGLVGSRFGAEFSGGVTNMDALTTPDGTVPNSGFHDQDLTARAAYAWGPMQIDYERLHHAAKDVGLPAFNSANGASGTYPLQGRDADRLDLTVSGSGLRPDVRVLAAQQVVRSDFNEVTISERFFRGNRVATNTTVMDDHVSTRMQTVEPRLHFSGPITLDVIGEYRREVAYGPRYTETTTRNNAGEVTAVVTEQSRSMPDASREGWAAGALLADTLLGTRVEAGLRFDALATRSDSLGAIAQLDARDERWSPEFGASRRFGMVEPYLHFASGFRAPSLDERYYNNEIHGGLRLFGNPELESEYSRLYEVGVRLPANRLSWMPYARLSVYRTQADNLISFRYVDQLYGVPRFQYFNVQNARIDGIEAELKLRHRALGARLNVSAPRGTDLDTGDRLADIGTARASLDLTLQLPALLPQGGVATRLLWNDAVRGSDDILVRPDYFVVHAEMSCVFFGVRGIVAVSNVGDVHYREPMSFIDAPGRYYTFALRREFNLNLADAGKDR